MNLEELRETLQRKHVELWVEGDLLRFRMPGDSLDKQLLAELRRHKKALIEAIKREAPGDGSESRLEPLSLGQQALFFLYSLSPQSAAYNVAAAVRIAARVDVEVMRHCFQTLLSRHEALRTTFETVDGNPRCRIHPRMELDFRQISAAAWDESQLHEAVKREYQHPFALKEGPLLRIRLFTIDELNHVFLMTLHHIIFDAWSLWLVQDEFNTLYRQQSRGETAVLPSLSATYSDFVRWQTELQHSERGEELWQYWRDRLKGELIAPDLTIDFPRPERPNHQGASLKFRVPRELSRRLRELGKRLGATPFVVLLAIFKTLIHRYTGQGDLTVGTTTSGRSGGAFTRLVGYFVNTLAIRTDVSGDLTFAEYLAGVKQRTLEAIEHQDYPFPLLVNRLNPRRDTGRLPICAVMFGLQKPQQFNEATRLFDEQSERADWGGLDVYPYDVPQQEGQFDLTLEMFDAHDSFLGTLKYDTDLFSARTADRMSRHFLKLAESIVADPHRPIFEYPLQPDDETELIASFNTASPAETHKDPRVHVLFEQQVVYAPDRIAALDEDTSLTYDELNKRANQLARLLQQLGIQPGDTVASHAARGVHTAITLLAILKAGGTYVPLDPACPHERLVHMIEDCRAKVLVSHSRFQAGQAARSRVCYGNSSVDVVCLDLIDERLAEFDTTNLQLDFPPDTAAYVIYTSGSTGEPKGVQVSQRAITQHVLSIRTVFGLVAKDRMLQFSNTTFDPSLEQMLVPWSVGASVFIRGQELWSPAEFWDQVRRYAVTAVNLPPAYFRHCSEALDQASRAADSLRLVIVGGDVFPVDAISQWQSMGVRLLNAYGPTEAVITATVHELPDKPPRRARIPIGRPKPGMRLYVLDDHLQQTPIGVPGELFLGGGMLADGYLNNPELTRERFVPDPFASPPFASQSGARLYRTGDRVRWTDDGELEFLGRCDRQVKIHGYRVEVGEIETQLTAYPGIREAHVQCRTDSHGDAFLVAWLGTDFVNAIDPDEVRNFLRAKLPGYMIPRSLMLLDRLPLNSSGKVSVRDLPEPKTVRPPSRQYVAPQTPIEQTLVDIWSRVLEVEHVGTHDNFFDLGGSSLTSLRIVALLGEAGLQLDGEQIKPELLFEYPTVAELAAFWASNNSPPSVTG